MKHYRMGCCLGLLGLGAKRNGAVELSDNVMSAPRKRGSSLGSSVRVKYDLDRRGRNVKVERAGGDFVISGEGVAVASLPLEQDAAYWELKFISPGMVTLGVARRLDNDALEAPIGNKETSWGVRVFCGVGAPPPSAEDGPAVATTIEEGGVMGCVFTQSEFPMLRFFKDCQEVNNAAVDRVRGLVYPVVQVQDGASVQFIFHEDDFVEAPPSSRYSAVMEVRDMI